MYTRIFVYIVHISIYISASQHVFALRRVPMHCRRRSQRQEQLTVASAQLWSSASPNNTQDAIQRTGGLRDADATCDVHRCNMPMCTDATCTKLGCNMQHATRSDAACKAHRCNMQHACTNDDARCNDAMCTTHNLQPHNRPQTTRCNVHRCNMQATTTVQGATMQHTTCDVQPRNKSKTTRCNAPHSRAARPGHGA
jgi:hypothetical protein